MPEDKLFYVGQKAFIEKEGKLLVLIDTKGHIDLPGGKIQEGESNLNASLQREVKEETGIEISVGAPFVRWAYQFKSGHRLAGKEVYLVGFRCAYVSGEIRLSDEHTNFMWVGRDDLAKMPEGEGHRAQVEEYFRM